MPGAAPPLEGSQSTQDARSPRPRPPPGCCGYPAAPSTPRPAGASATALAASPAVPTPPTRAPLRRPVPPETQSLSARLPGPRLGGPALAPPPRRPLRALPCPAPPLRRPFRAERALAPPLAVPSPKPDLLAPCPWNAGPGGPGAVYPPSGPCRVAGSGRTAQVGCLLGRACGPASPGLRAPAHPSKAPLPVCR